MTAGGVASMYAPPAMTLWHLEHFQMPTHVRFTLRMCSRDDDDGGRDTAGRQRAKQRSRIAWRGTRRKGGNCEMSA